MLSGVPTDVEVTALGDVAEGTTVQLEVDGAAQDLEFDDGVAVAEITAGSGEPTVRVIEGGAAVDFSTSPDGSDPATEATTGTIPGWTLLLPPFIAIAIALIFRQVIPALLVVWIGAWGTFGFSIRGPVGRPARRPERLGAGRARLTRRRLEPHGDRGLHPADRRAGRHHLPQRRDGGHRADGTAWASDRRRGQIATSVLGTVIFFDDYANTLVIGNALRPVTDRLQISREKLAYIVDSTAAPVASIALISTWIGFEVGLIGEAIGIIGLTGSGYSVFLNSLPYRFYPLLAILLVFGIAFSGRDFGPMLSAEQRAVGTGQLVAKDSSIDPEELDEELQPKDAVPRRLSNAVVPILVLVGVWARCS